MRAIGTIKSINIKGLKEYVLTRQQYKDMFDKEQEQFKTMYSDRIFPEQMKVRYDYSNGTYDANYGNNKHKYACRNLFDVFSSCGIIHTFVVMILNILMNIIWKN